MAKKNEPIAKQTEAEGSEVSVYRQARLDASIKDQQLSNAENASQLLNITRRKLLEIETLQRVPTPEDVVWMSRIYENYDICSYYCAHQCPVGTFMDFPDIDGMEFPEIAVKLMSAMHFFGKMTDIAFRIFADSQLSNNEIEDFKNILKTLDELADSTEALKVWARQKGIITEEEEC